MITDSQFDELVEKVVEIYQPITEEYLTMVGTQLKDIGTLTATNIKRVDQIATMTQNTEIIKQKLVEASGLAEKELENAFTQIAQAEYTDAAKYFTYTGVEQVALAQNSAIINMLQAELKTTAGTLINLSNTTNISAAYTTYVDKAIRQVSLGLSNYNTAISSVIRQAGKDGISVFSSKSGTSFVTYESGNVRRLDSAVRMNVLEGIRQTAINTSRITGEQYGADGVEVSAHGVCAPDHQHIQGQQYYLDDFDKLNENLARPVGKLNCKHYTFSIIMGVSVEAYSQDELDEINNYSNESITIDNITKTRYEWSQQMRRLETRTRYQKDISVVAQAANNMTVRRACSSNINNYKSSYSQITNATGLSAKKDLMKVSGYQYVKAS